MRRVLVAGVLAAGAVGVFAVLCACGPTTRVPESPPQSIELPMAACEGESEVTHPSHDSDTLRLELVEHSVPSPIVLPPLEIEPGVEEDLPGSVEMELTIHDPTGHTHVQRFHHGNMRERCDPYCLPVAGGPPCPPRRCWMERFRPPAVRIDPSVYRAATPGVWTFVLHRLDTDDRVSVARRLFEGEALGGQDCEALPERLGPFERVDCRRGIVPFRTRTHHWGSKARYARGSCEIEAFALLLDDNVRTVFDESLYGAADVRRVPEGAVREVTRRGATERAWLAHYHAYVLRAPEGLPGYDALVRAFLEVFPDVDGPDRPIPSCEDLEDDSSHNVFAHTVTPVQAARLLTGARVSTYFDGNRPSGARVHFPDDHPLDAAGLRRNEIIFSVDGRRVHRRTEVPSALGAMGRPGRVEMVVGRPRVRHARCIRVRIEDPPPSPPEPPDEPLDPPDADPPRDPGPRQGRHCERRSDRCWDCVDVTFPVEVGCDGGCSGRAICVARDGRERCLAPTRVCCMEGVDCDGPPGCDGVSHACSSDEPGGRHERCTFSNRCPVPLPTR